MTAGPEQAQWLRRAVATVVRLVPPGRVVAYGDIAELLGVGPRQVGRIMDEIREQGADFSPGMLQNDQVFEF